ncbi:MAG TPA: C39 family peptidase [Thermomicrobiales bacterium]|nr:C39 family peptidase [Thermomicrobiales bacterium]
MFEPGAHRISRRRLLSGAAAGAATLALGKSASASSTGITIKAPYLHQGGSGANEAVNCGPTTVAMAINYSGAAAVSVASVRATLGLDGPTDIDQWAWLLDVYRVPWYPTWSQEQMAGALRKGHPIVIATWMGALSAAGDYMVAWAQNSGWQGRYDSFSEGHAMLIVGLSEDGYSYLVHDPNVFPGDATGFYNDGTPKGAYRRYSAWELWGTVANYANGMGLAVVPYSQSFAPAKRIKRVKPEVDGIYTGPGGGLAPRRGQDQLT